MYLLCHIPTPSLTVHFFPVSSFLIRYHSSNRPSTIEAKRPSGRHLFFFFMEYQRKLSEAKQACWKRGKATNTTAQLRRQTKYPKTYLMLASVQKKNRVPAVPPASVVEQKFREAYLQGHQTVQRGKTEPGRAGAEATAHECVTNFTARFQDCSGGLGAVPSNTFPLHRHPYMKHTTTQGLLNCIVIIH